MRNTITKFWERYKPEIVFPWLAVFLTVFIPLYLKFPAVFVPGTFVTIRLEDFILLLVYVLLASYVYLKKPPALVKNFGKLFAAFFLLGFLSLLISMFGFGYLDYKLAILHWARRIEYMGIFFLGLVFPFNKKNLKIMVMVAVLSSALVSLYAIGQRYLNLPAVSTINSELSKGLVYTLTEFDRVNSTFSGHYDLAGYLLMHIPLCLGLVVYTLTQGLNKKTASVAGLLLSIATLDFYVLVLTAARLSFVALILSVLVLFILLKKYKWLVLSLVLFTASILYPSQLRDRMVATVRVNIQRTWNSYTTSNALQEARSKLNIPTLPADNKRIESEGVNSADIVPGEPTDATDLGVFRSLDIRLNVEWPKAIAAFAHNPLTGMGYSSLGLATDNDWLRALGETGILGFLAFGGIVLVVGKKLLGFSKTDKTSFYVSQTAMAIYLGFLVNSLFIDVFEASKIAILFWLYFGVIIGYLWKGRDEAVY